jgi:hypothetical protein
MQKNQHLKTIYKPSNVIVRMLGVSQGHYWFDINYSHSYDLICYIIVQRQRLLVVVKNTP